MEKRIPTYFDLCSRDFPAFFLFLLFWEAPQKKKLEVGWQHGRLSLFNVTMDRYSLLGIKWKLWVPLFICFECPISMTVKSMWMSIIFYLRTSKHHKSCKAELLQEGILFCTQFPSLGIFTNKKSCISKKLRPPSIQLLKLI